MFSIERRVFLVLLRVFLVLLRVFLVLLRVFLVLLRVFRVWLEVLRFWLEVLRVWLEVVRVWLGALRVRLEVVRFWLRVLRFWLGALRFWLEVVRLRLGALRVWLEVLRVWLRVVRFWLGVLRVWLRVLRVWLRVFRTRLRVIRIWLRFFGYRRRIENFRHPKVVDSQIFANVDRFGFQRLFASGNRRSDSRRIKHIRIGSCNDLINLMIISGRVNFSVKRLLLVLHLLPDESSRRIGAFPRIEDAVDGNSSRIAHIFLQQEPFDDPIQLTGTKFLKSGQNRQQTLTAPIKSRSCITERCRTALQVNAVRQRRNRNIGSRRRHQIFQLQKSLPLQKGSSIRKVNVIGHQLKIA